MNQTDWKARSAWSDNNQFKEVRIGPSSTRINGSVLIPGSKSFTNRALIIAAIAEGKSSLKGILRSDDSYWCIETLKNLGVEIEVNEDVVIINGVKGAWPITESKLYIGAAGTTARFLPGVLAAAENGRWIVEASNRMSERPIKPLMDALVELGATIKYLNKEGYYPIEISGTGLSGGDIWISGNLSSQFISGLLIASPYAAEPVTVNICDYIVQQSYVQITIELMKQFGVNVTSTDNLSRINIEKNIYYGRDITLEADVSTCCYFLALAALTKGTIRVNNITHNTHQPDIKMLEVFQRMGCIVEKGDTFVQVTGPAQLKGGFDISMKEMSDQTMTLAVLAIFADAPISIHDVAHIRTHESDRIKVICESLHLLGINTEEREDGLTVYPGTPRQALINSHDDHRIAMSLSLVGACVDGIRITDPGCVSKTCPGFFKMINDLGLAVEFIQEEK